MQFRHVIAPQIMETHILTVVSVSRAVTQAFFYVIRDKKGRPVAKTIMKLGEEYAYPGKVKIAEMNIPVRD